MNINLVVVAGRLTRNPESKALPSGNTVTTFSVATNRTWTKDGQKQEEVEYHNIVVFGKVAENCARYLEQGSLVSVEGRLQTRSWENEGIKHYRTEVVADRVQFGPHRDEPTKEKVVTSRPDYPEEEINPEDIPF